jgi:hypothetical protein
MNNGPLLRSIFFPSVGEEGNKEKKGKGKRKWEREPCECVIRERWGLIGGAFWRDRDV